MITAQGEIQIERPPEEAFDFIADLRNEPQFNPDASDIVKVTGGPVGLGTVYTENVKPLGAFEVTIDRYERPSLLGFDAKNARADIRVRFHFTPEGDGTRLRAEIEMQPKGALRLAEPLLRPMMRRMYERKRAPMIKQALERR
jgi:carbon monoxide dehydrogenase subunit G